MYTVYIHTVPNGKVYVGQTKNATTRWNNGEGYIKNRPFYKDIQIYGWKNIKHEIVAEFVDKESALQLESVLIVMLKSEDENYGYNQTTIYADAMKKYVSRTMAKDIPYEKLPSEESFFEQTNLPITACQDMINQWIFNEEHRKIAKSRLIDGLTYQKLCELYNKSERQLKYIVDECCKKLEKHL